MKKKKSLRYVQVPVMIVCQVHWNQGSQVRKMVLLTFKFGYIIEVLHDWQSGGTCQQCFLEDSRQRSVLVPLDFRELGVVLSTELIVMFGAFAHSNKETVENYKANQPKDS